MPVVSMGVMNANNPEIVKQACEARCVNGIDIACKLAELKSVYV